MRETCFILTAVTLVAACATTEDPAEGGFFSGVAGVTGGGYQARIDERENAVVSADAQNTALISEQNKVAAEIGRLRSELARLKFTILQQKTQLGTIDDATAAKIDAMLNTQPGGNTNAARLASLRRAVADARALSADLAQLSG